MITAVLVGVFGVAGALLRFAVDSWFAHRPGPRPHWPWATLTVNIVGSFLIGVSLGLTDLLGLAPEWHTALSAGLAGGLTTFSSWTTATVRLVSEARYRAAGLNVAVNLLAGLAAAALGLAL
ncbi:fluoride efflux transporter FluC [Pseudarthrobacter sp. MM222]|uniref:fluoride efflux transporter FluC n=1 Tax=Pseudarthrobacter sp. MM222 TaxID=3018929 RepID=UPI00221F9204|nr:CrcB family protein [Pseudarthrobacter sp. MM222]CAI3800980.1 Putative fluoride ion transporter CrcB [Pseudarthrobacter sp. MM222]